MKTVVKVTKNEKATLDALIKCLYAEAGFSDVDVKELSEVLNWSMPKVKGEIGSLVKKGIVYVDTDFDVISLTFRAYCLHPKWKEEIDIPFMVNDPQHPGVKNTIELEVN